MSVGFPHPTFEISDKSGASAVADTIDPGLFVPLFFTFAAKGVPNKILYTGDSSAVALLGSATFDNTSVYYNGQTRFLDYAAGRQGAYVVRLVDPAATTAALVLECAVTQKDLIQYQTDSLGNYITDANGQPKPKLAEDNTTPITEPGIVALWRVRAAAAGEDVTNLKVSTTTNGTTQSTVYPIMAFSGKYPGVQMNNWGFKLYRPSSIDTTTEANIKSVLYRLAPYFLDTSLTTTASPVSDIYSAVYNDFSFKRAAIDPNTSKNYALKSVIKNNYFDASGTALLDYDITTYGDNVKTIGDAVLSVSPELSGIVADGWGIDLITGQDESSHPYHHFQVDPSSVLAVSPDAIQYLQGGTDGDTSNTMFENLIQTYITNAKTSEFRNIGRYPFSHVIDSGFSMTTKYALLSLLGLRNNLFVVLSTQDTSLPPNSESEDISAAQAIAARAALYPESTITNVGVMRYSIYYHCAELAGAGAYDDIVPFTYGRLASLCTYDGGNYISDDPGGFPGSIVSLFDNDTINWVPNTEDEMSGAWQNCGNYVQYYDRSQVFFPSLRTGYTNDTSLCSDEPTVNRILYMFKILWQVWAKNSGRRLPSKKLFPLIEKDANDRINVAVGKGITANVTLVQTAQDEQLGYATDAIITITGAMPMRVMNFRFMIGRSTS